MVKKKPDKAAGKPLSEFLATYDKSTVIPAKLKAGIEQLADTWLPEAEFLRLCGLSVADAAAYRDQFEEFYVTTRGHNPKRMWFGDAKIAAQMREKVG